MFKENFMTRISVTLSDDLKQKISALAQKNGQSLEQCVAMVLSEYVENSEDDFRTDFCSVNNLERSFFLSIGD